jgi:hypothetical protein
VATDTAVVSSVVARPVLAVLVVTVVVVVVVVFVTVLAVPAVLLVELLRELLPALIFLALGIVSRDLFFAISSDLSLCCLFDPADRSPVDTYR